MLRLPPNAMSRKILHSFGDFSPVLPRCVIANCKASMFRFAWGERIFLQELLKEAKDILGDHCSLSCLTSNFIPAGCIDDPPILNSLLSALELREAFLPYRRMLETNGGKIPDSRLAINEASHVTLLTAASSSSNKEKSTQSEAYSLFSKLEITPDFEKALIRKICITVGTPLAGQLEARPDWFSKLKCELKNANTQAKVALFKTFIGGWTTTHRMGEQAKLDCLFGCKAEQDNLKHYLFCSPLWQITSEALGFSPPLSIEMRLCMSECSPQGITLLALAVQVYHYTKAQLKVDAEGGLVQPSPLYAQTVAQECA